MGLKVGELTAYLDIDDRAYNRKLDEGERKFGALSGKLKLAGVAAASAIGVGTVALAKQSIEAVSDLTESASKAEVVFGAAADRVNAFAEGASKSLGQTKQQALEATGTFGNLMVSLGMTEDKAADMSIGLVTLASDLASFNNTSVDDALLALRSGLVGETEPLKRFGVNLNEATLKEKAMELGLSDGKEQLDANTKALAAYALIMTQTKTAQGDFARTSDNVANRQRILAAQTDQLKVKVGAGLYPVYNLLLGRLIDSMPIFERVATAVGEGLSQAFEYLSGKGEALSGVLGIVTGVMGFTKDLFIMAWPAIKAVVEPVLDWLTGPSGMATIRNLLAGIEGAMNLAKSIFEAAWPAIQVAIAAAEPFITAALKVIEGAVWLVVKAIEAMQAAWWWLTGQSYKSEMREMWRDMDPEKRAGFDAIRKAQAQGLTGIVGFEGMATGFDKSGKAVTVKGNPDYMGGYALGGVAWRSGLYDLAEDDRPELVVPLTRQRRSEQLAGQYLGLDSAGIITAIQSLERRLDTYEATRRNDLRDLRLGVAYG